MSVREYSLEEIGQLYAGIRGIVSRLPLCSIDEDRLQEALRAAYYANRAALACTYNEEVKLARFELPGGFKPGAKLKEVFVNVGLLLYNCISNGGKDFMPEQDRQLLEGLQKDIAWHVIERLKEVDDHGNV